MGWSISHVRPEPSPAVDAAFHVLGRALYLATAYESKCIYVLRIARLASAAANAPDDTLEELLATAANRDEKLHRVICMLAQLPEIRPDEAALLWRAKVARNFIAHEGAAFGYVYSVRDSTVAAHLAKLRDEVAHLAAGDNVVSRIVYAIEEKELAPRHLSDRYPALVDAWVFGPNGREA